MSAPDIRTAKVLCHADGSLFCNYGPNPKETGYVHAIYMTEGPTPDPATLDIAINPDGCTRADDLVWFEFEGFTRPIEDRQRVAGTFNYTEAEFIAW